MHLARRFSPVLAAIFAFVVAAAVFGSVAPPAQAHDGLATSSPAADAVLDVAPTEITLSFTGNILGDAGANAVIVTDASGAQVQSGTVSVDGADIAMPLKEFELLELLLRNSGRVLTRGQLIDRVWGADYFGDTKTLDVHIKRIRSKIEKTPSEPTMLVTVRGLGYRFEA